MAAGGAGGFGGRFALARYNSDGTLDTSFSNDGKVVTNFTRKPDSASGVILQADGKIVAAGTARASDNANFALARYNSDGTLDTSFSSDGRVTTDFGFGQPEFGRGLALGDGGTMVVVGEAVSTASCCESGTAVARYTSVGTLDVAFSGDGKVQTDFTFAQGADDVVIQTDGKIVAAGVSDVFTDDSKFAILRFFG